MARPNVSVVIPTYDRAPLLPRALRSVQAQTGDAALEVLVVDDGSTDDTEAVVRTFPDARIRYLRHERNRGGSAARNTGIAAARAPVVAFLDSDDEWLPHKLDRQMAALRKRPAAAGSFTADIVCRDGRPLKTRFTTAEDDLREALLHRYVGATSSLVARRESLLAVGSFDEALARCQDWDLWLRISARFELVHLTTPLVRIHQHTGAPSITSSLATLPGYRRFLRKHAEAIRAAGPEAMAAHCFRLGKEHALAGQMPTARRCFARATCYPPWTTRLALHASATFLGAQAYRALASARPAWRRWALQAAEARRAC